MLHNNSFLPHLSAEVPEALEEQRITPRQTSRFKNHTPPSIFHHHHLEWSSSSIWLIIVVSWSVTMKRMETGGKKAHKNYVSQLLWIINGLIWGTASLHSRERSEWGIKKLFYYLPAKGCSPNHLIKGIFIVIFKGNKMIEAISQAIRRWNTTIKFKAPLWDDKKKWSNS